jgi:hypothetical protein
MDGCQVPAAWNSSSKVLWQAEAGLFMVGLQALGCMAEMMCGVLLRMQVRTSHAIHDYFSLSKD